MRSSLPRTVFVLSLEPLSPNGVGGFDWFYQEDDLFEELQKSKGVEGALSGYVHVIFPHITELHDPQEITDEIERRLLEMPDIRPFVNGQGGRE